MILHGVKSQKNPIRQTHTAQVWHLYVLTTLRFFLPLITNINTNAFKKAMWISMNKHKVKCLRAMLWCRLEKRKKNLLNSRLGHYKNLGSASASGCFTTGKVWRQSVPVQVNKEHGGVEVQIHSPTALTLGRIPWHPLNRRLDGPHRLSGRSVEETDLLPLLEIQKRFLGRPTHI